MRSIIGIVHFKSNTLLNTILNTFWTLIEWEADVNINGAFIAFANFIACFDVSSCSSAEHVVKESYFVPTKNGNAFYSIHQCPHLKKCRRSYLVKASNLSIPFFYARERWFSRQVKHKKYSYSIVADQRQHANEFSLTYPQFIRVDCEFSSSSWPPRSQIEKVISVFLNVIVFSMKLTPKVWM